MNVVGGGLPGRPVEAHEADDDDGSSERGGWAVVGGTASGVGALLALGLVDRRRREA